MDAVLFLRRTESYIVTLQQLGRCLDAGSGKQPVVLDFVNNLSGKSVYDVMACHWERLSYLPSPHGFEGTTSFLATGYLSDIRLRIEEILAELEPWQIMYERLVEFHREENDWPSVTEGNWVFGATRNASPTNEAVLPRNGATSLMQSVLSGISSTPNG